MNSEKIIAAIENSRKLTQKDIEKSKQELLSAIETTNAKVHELENEIKVIKEENRKLVIRMEKQEKQNEYLIRQIKSKNLIVHGILAGKKETKLTLREQILKLIKDKLLIDLKLEEIDQIMRIGEENGKNPRPILLTLRTISKRNEILLANKKPLIKTNIYK